MEVRNHHKVIFCIIILLIVLYIYYNSRIPGCMDKKQLIIVRMQIFIKLIHEYLKH